MGLAGGTSILKFINYGVVILILIGIIAGAINGFIEYRKTGDKTMLIDKTLGEVVVWDTKIYLAMNQLTNEEFIKTVPEELRSEYVTAIAKSIVINLLLLSILIYAIFRFGNWLSGKSQFEPTTDLFIMLTSFSLVFIVIPLVYGYLMHKDITLFRGIWTFITNINIWWNALSGIPIVASQTITNEVTQQVMINMSG